MFKNYLKLTVRNLRRNKVYSIITIFGLSVGLACSMLMLVFVYYEFSYDRFNEKAEQIYRIGREISSAEGELREPLSNARIASVLKQDYPEVIDAVRFKNIGKVIAKYGDNNFYEEHVYYADPSVFNVFTFPLIAGDPNAVLSSPYSIVITEEMAQKYFGNENPLGKVLTLDNKNDFIVTGIMKDLPETTHRKINMLCSFETLVSMKDTDLDDWLSFNYSTYLLLRKNADYNRLESTFPKLIDRYVGENTKTLNGKLSFYILPLTKLHLFSHLDGFSPGLITKIISYCSMALLLTLIACINFINLSTARSSARAKEIGIRKVVGSGKGRLVKQFLFESVIVSMFALLFSFLLVELLLPAFRNKVESKLLLSSAQMNEIYIGFFLLALIIGFVSGLYPAFYLSRFQPVQALRGNLFVLKKTNIRSILVVIQFALSVILICHTFNVNRQFDYLTQKDVGFNKNNLVVLPVVNDKIKESLETFKTILLNNPDITGVTIASALPGIGIPRNVKMPEGFSKNEMQLMDEINVDADFIKTLGIKVISGRNFIADSKFDQQNSVIINELAAKKFGWSNPLGKTIQYTAGNDHLITGTVIGVVKDFHLSSMFRLIEPLFMSNNSENLNHVLIHINPENTQASLKFIKDKWKSLYPDYPFQYDFLEASYDIYFRIFDKIKEVLTIFAFLAILLACLGIFALSTFIAEKRTKEIGIRKVLGDTSIGIIFRLNFELLKYVLIATLLIIPYSYFTRDFLQLMMPYTTDPGLLVYVKGVVLVFIVALLTISYQSIKAANTNPVESLKYE
jgi:putative ABC transport system permease protein